MKQNMHHAFWYISLLSLHHLDPKFPCATLFKHTRRIFLQLQGNSPTFSVLSKLEYMLFFFFVEKKKRIHFCDIFAALADVVAEAPYISCVFHWCDTFILVLWQTTANSYDGRQQSIRTC